MRPHSLHRPKALFRLAGDEVLGHVLGTLSGLDIDRATVIVGPDGAAIQDWFGERCGWPAQFIVQPEPLGQAAALALAGEQLVGETLVVFADTLFETDMAALNSVPAAADGLLHVMPVADPSAFGVVLPNRDGTVARLVEKPRVQVSGLAVMGLYWLRDGEWLLRAAERVVAEGPGRQGECYIAEVLQRMIDEGARLLTRPVEAWHDCGNPADTLSAHRYLLQRRLADDAAAGLSLKALQAAHPSARFLPPVHVGPGARIAHSLVGPHAWIEADCQVEHSLLGPHVTLGAGSRVHDTSLRDVITERGVRIRSSQLRESLLGRGSRAAGYSGSLNLGDASRIGPEA